MILNCASPIFVCIGIIIVSFIMSFFVIIPKTKDEWWIVFAITVFLANVFSMIIIFSDLNYKRNNTEKIVYLHLKENKS